MRAQELNVDVIANNLANVNTTGFKKGRADFQDLLYQVLRAPGSPSSVDTMIPTGIQLGAGVRPAAVQKVFLQGDLRNTENPFDMAIEGDGFFQILLPNGLIAYTRAGDFKLDRDGRFVTSDGFPLDPQITVPDDTTSVTVGTDGTVSVQVAGQPIPQEIGNIELVKFLNPAGLQAIGRNLFLETDASGAPIPGIPGEQGLGTTAQGYLETSNVSVVEEMVNMITAQRAYEINSQSVRTSDEMLQLANNLKR
jgi:flagellar basal-body rod protein FlgG